MKIDFKPIHSIICQYKAGKTTGKFTKKRFEIELAIIQKEQKIDVPKWPK